MSSAGRTSIASPSPAPTQIAEIDQIKIRVSRQGRFLDLCKICSCLIPIHVVVGIDSQVKYRSDSSRLLRTNCDWDRFE